MGLSFPSCAVGKNYLQGHRWSVMDISNGQGWVHHPARSENHLQLWPLTQACQKWSPTPTAASLLCWGQLHLVGSRAGDSPADLAEAAEPQELCRRAQPSFGGSAQGQCHCHWNTAPASASANEMEHTSLQGNYHNYSNFLVKEIYRMTPKCWNLTNAQHSCFHKGQCHTKQSVQITWERDCCFQYRE